MRMRSSLDIRVVSISSYAGGAVSGLLSMTTAATTGTGTGGISTDCEKVLFGRSTNAHPLWSDDESGVRRQKQIAAMATAIAAATPTNAPTVMCNKPDDGDEDFESDPVLLDVVVGADAMEAVTVIPPTPLPTASFWNVLANPLELVSLTLATTALDTALALAAVVAMVKSIVTPLIKTGTVIAARLLLLRVILVMAMSDAVASTMAAIASLNAALSFGPVVASLKSVAETPAILTAAATTVPRPRGAGAGGREMERNAEPELERALLEPWTAAQASAEADSVDERLLPEWDADPEPELEPELLDMNAEDVEVLEADAEADSAERDADPEPELEPELLEMNAEDVEVLEADP